MVWVVVVFVIYYDWVVFLGDIVQCDLYVYVGVDVVNVIVENVQWQEGVFVFFGGGFQCVIYQSGQVIWGIFGDVQFVFDGICMGKFIVLDFKYGFVGVCVELGEVFFDGIGCIFVDFFYKLFCYVVQYVIGDIGCVMLCCELCVEVVVCGGCLVFELDFMVVVCGFEVLQFLGLIDEFLVQFFQCGVFFVLDDDLFSSFWFDFFEVVFQVLEQCVVVGFDVWDGD